MLLSTDRLLSLIGSELCATVASDCLPIELVHLDGFPRARWFGNIAQDPDTMPPDSKVEVIATHNQPHIAIVIECRLEFGGRLFGSVLRSIERLDLEVRQCSITNCSNLYLCNASCKVCNRRENFLFEMQQ